MAPHDPLFKRLLQTFFASFLRLVAPEVAARLDLAAPVFLDKEFTDSAPPGRSRVVDLLACLPLQNGGRLLLIHVEVEARARAGIGERLREYHRWIQTRHKEQILSIVVYLKGGRGLCEKSLEADLVGPGLTSFRYLSFGLAHCSAAEYLASPEPLAWALAALMEPGEWSRAELKRSCLLRVAESSLEETEREELVNCIETYLQLTSGEAEEFASLGVPERRAKAMLYRMSWADKMMIEGQSKGAQSILLSLLEEKFGVVPEDVRKRIEDIQSLDRLNRLARKALTAKSLKSLRLG